MLSPLKHWTSTEWFVGLSYNLVFKFKSHYWTTG